MPGSPTDSEPIERELSEPEVDEAHALDASISEAALDDLEAALVSDVDTSDEPRESEVQIVRPKEIGDESSDRFKTQLGGLEAQADLAEDNGNAGEAAELEAEAEALEEAADEI